MNLSSIDWAILRVLEVELRNIDKKETVVIAWLQNRINSIKNG